MSCCVIVPGSVQIEPPDPVPHCYEVAKLILTHYSRYWKLGQRGLRRFSKVAEHSAKIGTNMAFISGVLASIRQGLHLQPGDSGTSEREMMKRFSILLPPIKCKMGSQGLPPNARVQHEYARTVEMDPESWSSPELDEFYNSDLFQWPLEAWATSFGGFEAGQLG